jgi:predicted kinase
MEKVVEKKRKERFETFPTELPGVKLRIEPETKLDILRKTIESFYQLAKEFARVKFQIDDLTNQQDSRREEIIGIAKEHKGLRGLTSEKDNFVLTVIPREKVIWNRELLKESLGIAYSAVTREELVVSISIPIGFVTEKGVTISEEVMEKVIKKALTNLGIPREELTKVMRQEVNVTLDEEKLTEMVNQGQVKLLEGAKTSEITWQVRVDRLKK